MIFYNLKDLLPDSPYSNFLQELSYKCTFDFKVLLDLALGTRTKKLLLPFNLPFLAAGLRTVKI